MGLAFLDIGMDQIFPQYLDIGSYADLGKRQCMGILCRQPRMIELLCSTRFWSWVSRHLLRRFSSANTSSKTLIASELTCFVRSTRTRKPSRSCSTTRPSSTSSW